jgi:hypothetical protein
VSTDASDVGEHPVLFWPEKEIYFLNLVP